MTELIVSFIHPCENTYWSNVVCYTLCFALRYSSERDRFVLHDHELVYSMTTNIHTQAFWVLMCIYTWIYICIRIYLYMIFIYILCPNFFLPTSQNLNFYHCFFFFYSFFHIIKQNFFQIVNYVKIYLKFTILTIFRATVQSY